MHVPYALAQRLKAKRMLWWAVAHPDDIAKQNFLMGADYDALRAIYAALPDRPFDLDARPKGAKAAWRAALVARVKDLASRERREKVPAGWDAATGAPKFAAMPALAPASARCDAASYSRRILRLLVVFKRRYIFTNR